MIRNRSIHQGLNHKESFLQPLVKPSSFEEFHYDNNPFVEPNIFLCADEKTYQRQLDLYKLLREQIKHEDELINERLTWSLTAQGLLFIAYSALMSFCMETVFGYIFVLVIGSLGIILCLTTYTAINSAVASLERIRYYEYLQRKHNQVGGIHLRLPPISGAGAVKDNKSVNVHINSIPFAFGIAWLMLIIAPLVLYFLSKYIP